MHPRAARRDRARTIVHVTALSVAAVTLLAGCLTPRRPPRTTTTTTKPAPPAGYYVTEARDAAPGTTPWFCNAAGNGTPIGGHGNGSHVNPIYEGKTKGPLSQADCATLAQQLDEVLTVVQGLDTRGKGEAAGWRASAEYIAGLGTHHVKGNSVGGALGVTTFDLKNPQFLIYAGSDAEAPLVGVSYGAQGAAPPASFAGGNAWWHLHKKICLDGQSTTFPPKILAGAEEIADAECTALGGFNAPVPGGGLWLLHLWPVPPHQYRLDLFSSGHNCLLADRIAPSNDPCWEIARRDPALGLPPGTGGGDHGGDHAH